MNALDREIAEIIAAYLHDQDPRYIWTPRPVTNAQAATPHQRPGSATQADQDHRATQHEDADRRAA